MSILSNRCKYGIRAVIYLALNSGETKKIGIKKISHDLDIPMFFLGKILQNLAKHKILVSTKGPNGGFGLAREPKDITMLDLIEVIDGLDLFNECLIGLKSCSLKGKDAVPCPTNRKFQPIRDQMHAFFKNETIENLKNEIVESEGTVGI
ncbi:MAG: Rrf2 family transcriptional regulator [Bacteroidales bacterium]